VLRNPADLAAPGTYNGFELRDDLAAGNSSRFAAQAKSAFRQSAPRKELK
jgi:hypothetical protein